MKVVSKQANSKMCLICGLENNGGLKADFYNMEDGSVGSIFTFKDFHQSYPERVHGGMISALLDELAGRAIWVTNPELFGVTGTLNVKFRKPVPYNEKLYGRGYITLKKEKVFIAKAQITNESKVVLAECEATYVILPVEKIFPKEILDDVNVMVEDDIKEIDF